MRTIASRTVFHQSFGNHETGSRRIFSFIRNSHKSVAVITPKRVICAEPKESVIVLHGLAHHEPRGPPIEVDELNLRSRGHGNLDDSSQYHRGANQGKKNINAVR